MSKTIPCEQVRSLESAESPASTCSQLDSQICHPINKHFTAPLSFGQERLWFLNLLSPESPVYNVGIAVRLSGELDRNALKQALTALVERHEILRSNFVASDGHPEQLVSEPRTVVLDVVNLRSLNLHERASHLEELLYEEVRRPFNLEKDLMLRACLLQCEDQDHTLCITMHHIGTDGSSMEIFHRELASLYEAFARGEQPKLPTMPVQYRDFCQWQRKRLEGETLGKHLTYWKEKLKTTTPNLNLPTDWARPSTQSYRGARKWFHLPADLAFALRRLSARHCSSLFMTFLAAFEILLYRYSGQLEFVVGTPISSRPAPEFNGLIGFFLNTLVLPADLKGDPSFTELLKRVRTVSLQALDHSDLPFEKLVEALQPERDLSRTALFQVMFTMQKAPTATVQLQNLKLISREVDTGTSKFDLFLCVQENGQELGGYVEYCTDLFDGSTVERMLGHFETLLKGIVHDDSQCISRLPLLTGPERKRMLVDWNQTAADYPAHVCLHELIEAQVERSPDCLAVVFEGQHLTYRELNRRANQLSHYLRKLGVAPETVVGVFMHRSMEMLISLLAILKAGGAYLPLDPEYPTERLRVMLEDSETRVILTQSDLLKRIPDTPSRLISVDTEWEEFSAHNQENPANIATVDNIAYVIYTSGSTGKPKGVLNTHKGIVNRLLWMQDAYRLTPDDRVLQKTPYSFDVSVWEFFWPLLTGARLVFAKPNGHKDPTYLVDLIELEAISTVHFVPSMLSVFLEAADSRRCVSLRRVICSGEALTSALQTEFFDKLDCELHNLYGPTEAAVDVTSWHCRKDCGLSTVPIGRPIANIQIYLLDPYLHPVPVGVAGELHIGGVGLARGYLNRPELTAEKFIPNPFADGHLYKTGDLARFLPGGDIEYIGRIDSQVKIRGFRIELGDIESALAEHPQIQQVLVIAREGACGDKYLVAYVVPKLKHSVSADDLGSFLRGKLPEYMVPSAFICLPSLPLSTNGKIDRRALPQPDTTNAESSVPTVPPRDPVEEQLSGIWENVLNRRNFGVRHDFFELGGHSLAAARLVARMDATFGTKLPLASIFRAPTIEKQAELIRQPRPAQLVQVVPIQPGGSHRPFFCVCMARGPMFRPLAERLGEGQPFLGLDMEESLVDLLRVPYTFEDIASHLVRQIRKRQAQGPYILGGFCLNGVIAFEVAQQLTAIGEDVSLLVLFESMNPVFYDGFGNRTQLKSLVQRLNLDRLKHHFRALQDLDAGEMQSYLSIRAKEMLQQSWRIAWQVSIDCQQKLFGEKLNDLQQILYAAAKAYRPKSYAGRIVLFRCTDRRVGPPGDLEAGWAELAPCLEVHEIRGDHLGILDEPNLGVLATKLDSCLREVQYARRLSSSFSHSKG